MYLSRRFEIKNDLIHLDSVAKWLGVPQTTLLRKNLKPVQNKLLSKVKKRLKTKKKNMNFIVKRNVPLSAEEVSKLPSFGQPRERQESLKKFIKDKEELMSPKSINDDDDEDKASMMSNGDDRPRVSIMDIINMFNQKTKTNKHEVFIKFSKKDKDGTYFMNTHDFKSFLTVFLDLKITNINKRTLFSVIDLEKDNYVEEPQFMKMFRHTKENIDDAINNPHDPKNFEIVDAVIEQIYHAIVYFKESGIAEIEKKLDKKG